MAQPQRSFAAEAAIATVTFLARDVIAPPVRALVGGLADGVRALVRWAAPWAVGLGAIVVAFGLWPEAVAQLISTGVVIVLMGWVAREWFRAAFGGKKRR